VNCEQQRDLLARQLAELIKAAERHTKNGGSLWREIGQAKATLKAVNEVRP
jgi:hypothetical protein